jgi:nucleotide-binding universal stress UspA family protein
MRFAEAFDARLDLLHVIEDLFRPVGYGYTLRSVYEVEPGIEERLREALHIFRAEVAEDFQRFGPMEILPGPPAKSIVEVAERLGSGLLVLGTQGLRGLHHLVMGSVAETVVRTAPCPVLAVKTADAAAEAQRAIKATHEAMTSEGPPLRIEPHPPF